MDISTPTLAAEVVLLASPTSPTLAVEGQITRQQATPTPEQLVLANFQPVVVLKRDPKQCERKNRKKGQDSQPTVTAPEPVPDQWEQETAFEACHT